MSRQRISHYRIEDELGRGGMGVVYRAYDEQLRRPVALKLLGLEAAGQVERRARILGEARAAAALNHPGIVTVHEAGEEGQEIFLVMELLSGKSLRAALQEGALAPLEVARLGAQLADALAAAHDAGVVHGDIKPENMILLAGGRLKLLDFGIARQRVGEAATMTGAGPVSSAPPGSHLMGTLAYMAPELLQGQEGGPRADLFSLGLVLYELACGSRPFPGPTATALASQILNERAPRLARTGLPHELDRIVHKLLEKRPEERYQSARDLHVDLNRLARELELGAVLPAAVAGKRAVAVLPFRLLTPNPEDDYLGVALADALINHLGADHDWLVRPISTVMRYTRQSVDPLQAARELNVQVIVDGSIQKFGSKLRIHVQAWDAGDGASLGSAKHDGDAAALFELQDRMAQDLAHTLGGRAPRKAAPVSEPPTHNVLAYELYLRGIERSSRLNRWDTRTAIEMLENAVQLDPRFADAWARLAAARLQMAVVFDPAPHWFKEAEREIQKAQALDRHNVEAQVARGRLLFTPAKGFQNRAALRALQGALRLNPSSQQALIWQGLIFLHIGMMEEARGVLATALANDPEDAFTLTFFAQTAHYMGRYEEAHEYQSRVLRVDPAHLWANMFLPNAALYLRKLEEAEQNIRAARQVLPGDPMLTGCEALLWALRGENRKAADAAAKALKSKKRSLLHTHHMIHNVAAVYAVLGKPGPAIKQLADAAHTGLPNYPAFRDDPFLRLLEGQASYQRLMTALRKECEGYRREFGSA